jgi:hypothetical protein
MGLESRVASHGVPATLGRACGYDRQQGRVLVEGSLVGSIYEQPNGKGDKSKTTKITWWSIRADVVRKLDRNEPEPQPPA